MNATNVVLQRDTVEKVIVLKDRKETKNGI